MPHEEQEEARTCQRHKNLAANRGRDELTCCRDNVVHNRNNVFAEILYRKYPEKASPKHQILTGATCVPKIFSEERKCR